MTAYFNTLDGYNKPVLGAAADDISALTAQLARKLHRQERKVNSGTPAQAKAAAPWYRRFDKR